MAEIEYFFTQVSPFTYLGHRAFLEIAKKHGAAIRYRPVQLAKIFAHSGAKPLPERPQARLDYRLVELQRWREKRGLPLNLKPKYFPSNPALADRCAIAIAADGGDPGGFVGAMLAACWAEEKEIADEAVVREKLEASGHDADTILDAAKGDDTLAAYERNTADAIGYNAIGAPNYVLNGEVFWGQDRLELLDGALASGRDPYTP